MSNFRIARAVRTALFSAAALGAALQAAPALSQESTDELGEIVVTGSRIPRANLTAPTAVTTIDIHSTTGPEPCESAGSREALGKCPLADKA